MESTVNLISRRYLSSPLIRDELLHQLQQQAGNQPQCHHGFQRIKELLFTDLYQELRSQPDYFWYPYLDEFTGSQVLAKLTQSGLTTLSQPLQLRNNRIYVDESQWQEWQTTIHAISPLLLICQFLINLQREKPFIEPDEILRNCTQDTCIPSIFCPQIEHFLKENKLTECHIHINGTTEPDAMWQIALNNPIKFYHAVKSKKHDSKSNELFLLNTNFRPEDLPRHLKYAAKLRDNLIKALLIKGYHSKSHARPTSAPTHSSAPESKINIDLQGTLVWPDIVHPYRRILGHSIKNGYKEWQYEGLFIMDCLREISMANDYQFGLLFQCYISVYHSFQHILVQQKKQIGFDQFQKIVDNNLRDQFEDDSKKSYARRFGQLQGMYDHQSDNDHSMDFLEARYSPKATVAKNRKLFGKIGNAVLSSPLTKTTSHSPSKLQLTLVAHFIKKPDKRAARNIITFRFLKLRKELRKTMMATLITLKRPSCGKLKAGQTCFSGFDAAANEWHTPPEVFSPVFRELRFRGFSNFTYHAGEDFTHILGGMRAIWEAIHFLQLESGNRIGHGTAIGIEPELWAQRYANKNIRVTRGDWLDNLVFAWYFLQDLHADTRTIVRLEQNIITLAHEIYGAETFLTLHNLVQAWQNRHLDPHYLFNFKVTHSYNAFEQQEKEAISKLPPDVTTILKRYHSGPVIAKSRETIEIAPMDIVSCDQLRQMQNQMLKLFIDKNLALETLPSSNVTISFYRKYEEHHLLRWLGLKDADTPKPSVIVGSDDTGLFMTNLRNEFSFVYKLVADVKGPDYAIEVLERLNKNVKQFRFKPEKV